MKDENKTNKQLINELIEMRKRISRLEASETQRKQAEEALGFEHKQLLSIFDSIDEVVYVSDPKTYEILYINKAIRDMFGNVVGQKCYKAFQNMDSPCPFCTNDRIFGENAGQPYIWVFQNRINKRWYHCIDKAIRWPDGRLVRYEMAIDITERKCAEEERERLITELQEAMASIKTLSGLLPICSSCKKIRDDKGYWNQIEAYIRKHSEADFSHSICPDCMRKLYPFYEEKE